MRKTGDFRSKNRRAYQGAGERAYKESYEKAYKETHGRTHAEGYRRESGENIYRELTREGQRFCAAAGLLEEIVVLAACGIRVSMAPVPVLAFLWVLFVILTAAALIGVSSLLDRITLCRPAPEEGRRQRCVNPASACQAAAAGEYVRGTEKIAA